MCKKSAFVHVLKDHVYKIFVIEAIEQGEDILMIDKHLQFDFKDKLINHKMWSYHILGYFLDSKECPSLFMKPLIDSSKLALT